MCGIGGVATENAILEVRNMLPYLQHRGPQAAGAATLDGHTTWLRKDVGNVADVLPVSQLERMVGDTSIGHVRYVTSGNNGAANAQPLYDPTSGIAIAYNGHVMNQHQLIDALAAVRRPKQLDTDTEQLLGVFSWNYLAAQNAGKTPSAAAYHAAARVMDTVMGAFALVATIPEVGLLACKSPNGTRPLMYGIKTGSTAFASESMPLFLNGYRGITDLLGGECIIVDSDRHMDKQQLRPERRQSCGFEWVYFAKAPSHIEGIRVNNVRKKLGELLAQRYQHRWDGLDIVVPVPKTPIPIAEGFAAASGIQFSQSLEKIEGTRVFLEESQDARVALARKIFFCYEEEVEGKRVALIDDSIVRGVNSREVVSKLRHYGATEVHLFSAWPEFRNPCRMGIDTPTAEELAAYNRTLEEIRAFIGADSVNYATIEDIVAAIGSDRLCLACIDGKYPSTLVAPEPILLPA